MKNSKQILNLWDDSRAPGSRGYQIYLGSFFVICIFFCICCTLRSKMQFQQFSIHKIYVTMHGKLSELHCNVLLFSNRGENVWKTRGQICPILFLKLSMTFSLRLENNVKLQCECSSDNFPCLVTYILYMENCWNCILMHTCLPIAGRLS